eukprot:5053680-Lingulodinium_polyedra.AAC.1
MRYIGCLARATFTLSIAANKQCVHYAIRMFLLVAYVCLQVGGPNGKGLHAATTAPCGIRIEPSRARAIGQR